MDRGLWDAHVSLPCKSKRCCMDTTQASCRPDCRSLSYDAVATNPTLPPLRKAIEVLGQNPKSRRVGRRLSLEATYLHSTSAQVSPARFSMQSQSAAGPNANHCLLMSAIAVAAQHCNMILSSVAFFVLT